MIHSEPPSQSILMYSSYNKHRLRSNWGTLRPPQRAQVKGSWTGFVIVLFLCFPLIALDFPSSLLSAAAAATSAAVAVALLRQHGRCRGSDRLSGKFLHRHMWRLARMSHHISALLLCVCLHLALVQNLVQCKAFQLNGCRWIPNVC